MNFKAQPTTISDLFSVQKSYKVARNQREFSWTEEEVEELWSDITRNIKWSPEKNSLVTSEYFIGSIVLTGHEDSNELIIIDGQQRTTVITIILCAIRDTLMKENSDAAQSINSTFIEGSRFSSSMKNEKYFKIERPDDSLFFKCQIQSIVKDNNKSPVTPEDELLYSAYKTIIQKVNSEKLLRSFGNTEKYNDLSISRNEMFRQLITQITEKIKLVRIVVDNEEDAYVIFEILNARGKDLDSSDLIKNKLFSDLRRTHPIDFAKDRWDGIKSELTERSRSNSLSEYIRYWWNARHPVVGQDNLFKEIKLSLDENEISSEQFIESLLTSSKIYKKICDPAEDDWKKENYKLVYFPLSAFKTFNVKMIRPIVLTLFEVFYKRKIKQEDFIRALRILEDFTFIFTAVCSQRPTGIENIYSAISKKLHNSSDIAFSKTIINELAEKLNNRKPSFDVFQAKLQNIELTRQRTKDKPLFKYIFKRYESHIRRNYELIAFDLSIEHISPQNQGITLYGTLGNLLPLAVDINNILDSDTFNNKINEYKKSNYQITSMFASTYQGKIDWTTDDIKSRNQTLASLFYSDIWKVKR